MEPGSLPSKGQAFTLSTLQTACGFAGGGRATGRPDMVTGWAEAGFPGFRQRQHGNFSGTLNSEFTQTTVNSGVDGKPVWTAN